MSEEIFDIVNECDEVIGRAPRREVHARGLLHRAVHVLVFNARNEVFLQKRSMLKDRQPGVWDSSSSGHVESGEDYDTTALRELREELGWQPPVAPLRLLYIAPCEATDHEFIRVYRCTGEGPFTLHPEEIECGAWFSTEHVTRWIAERPQDFATAFAMLWELLSKQTPNPSGDPPDAADCPRRP